MRWVIYNLLFAAVFPLMLPGFLLRMLRRGGYRARMGDRFALYPPGLLPADSGAARDAGFVWVHAVSVGEVQVASQMMSEWRRVEPGVRFCFSTTSSTGWRMAEKAVSPRDVLVYNPLDFPNFVKSALFRIRPRAVVLTESEIWPNFIRTASKAGIPLFLINARVSDRSAPRYRMARVFFGDVFRRFTRIFSQSDLDTARLVAAGAKPATIETTGSFKFDTARRNPAKEAEMREWISQPGRILLGGSTWPGEDKVLLEIAKTLEDVVLVIAPRHFEKADAVEANILEAGFACVRRSRGDATPADGRRAVYLADTTGELMGLYGIADAVFVGKTLFERGGQNMIESCLCGKPTVVGPHTENFRPVMDDLLSANAILQVKDAAELGEVLRGMSTKGDGGLGARAASAVRRRVGTVAKCVAEMRAAIPALSPPAQEPPFQALPAVLKGAVVCLVMALAIAAALLSRDVMPRWRVVHKTVVADTRPLPKLNALRTVAAFVALVENPGAASAFVAGDDAERAAAALRAAGVRCAGGDAGHDGPAPREDAGGDGPVPREEWGDGPAPREDAGHDGPAPREEGGDGPAPREEWGDGPAPREEWGDGPAPQEYDVVLWAGEAPGDWGCALEKVAAAGVLVWAFDAHRMKAAEFKAALEAFPCEKAHLWMPGERDWILAGRKDGGAVKMSEVLDVFSRPEAVTPEAEEAGCGSMQELFANYVGSRADIMPAFESGDMSAKVRPEFFVSRETPDLDWIVPDDMDADIVLALAEKIRAMQDVRRKIVGACARSYEPDGMDDAVRDWAEAMKANPHDTMLLDRLYLMAVNARAFHDVGNIAGAAQCYEAMVAIRPGDRRVVMEYARCLKSLGKTDKAAAVERSLREKDAEQRL